MEKLLDIPKSKFGDTSHYRLYRLQCDCLQTADALDIDVESCGKENERKYIILRLDSTNHSFLDRLKHAWGVLSHDWAWREFSVREEDYKSLSMLFDPEKKYSELP